MIQHNRAVFYGIVCVILSIFLGLFGGLSSVFAGERVQLIKTYELSEDVGYIMLSLEGYDGPFSSTLTLPDGHRIKNGASTRIQGNDVVYWTNAYALTSASKGTYTFTIDAPKQAYYNLAVDIPLFSDIAGHWAKDEITAFVQKGIVNGYGNGKFGPNDEVTGEALVKMLVLALTEEQPHGKRQWVNVFRWKVLDEEKALALGFQEYDLAAAAGMRWSEPYLKAAADLEIASEWSSKDLRRSFKRQDVALMVANVMDLVTAEKPESALYKDTGKLGAEVQAAIALVSSQAIFDGYPDGTFQPDKPVTRAEAVKILSRLLEFLN